MVLEFIRICNNINLVRTVIWPDIHIMNHLITDLINRDRSRFLMFHHDNIRMILTHCFLTGIAFLTRFRSACLTLERSCKSPGKKFLTRAWFTGKDIRM